MTDEMTRLYNRRCYDEDLKEMSKNELAEDLVFFSIDVNGKHFTDKDLLIKNLTPSDANFFAWYCIERTVNSK